MKAWVLGLFFGVWMLLGMATPVWAHAAQTDYFVDLFASELQLEFTASFSTGEPMDGAIVTVYAPGDRSQPWEESTTDETGHYTFKPDAEQVGDWRIEFEKEGHQDIRIVPVDDLGIDYQNISHGGNVDYHPYAHLREGLALFSAAGIGAGAIVFQRRLFSA